MGQLTLPLKVAVEREVDGVEMGVLVDGTPFLSGRSLAKLCGTAISTIINQADRWGEGRRDNKLAKNLVEAGFRSDQLFIPIQGDGPFGVVHAYTDEVATIILEYYAFDAERPNETARSNFRKLAKTSLRMMIYAATGYDPSQAVPLPWRQYHDRMLINNAPPGYFSVFKEIADVVLASIQKGMVVDAKTMPDGSVGILWAQYWEAEGLEPIYGSRLKHPHNFPSYFPQAKGKMKEAWVYPVEALGAFRRWLTSTYLPTAFPSYLANKVKQGHLPASTRELILEAVEETYALPPGKTSPALPSPKAR